MKVFVTGASGFVGGAVVPELLKAGHKVVALARSAKAEQKIKQLDPHIEIVKGSLKDLDVLKRTAAASDGVVHLGFIQDFSRFEEVSLIDRKATLAMLDALKGTNKPYVQTAVALVFPPGTLGTETSPKHAVGPGAIRSETEDIVLSHENKGVRATSVRLPPSVHGGGDPNFITALVKIASGTKKSYINDGANLWAAVSRFDAGVVFRLALEKGHAGTSYHAVAEEGVKTKDIAGAIGQLLKVPVVSVEGDKAAEHFKGLAAFFSGGGPVSSKITQEQLGWQPKEIGLLDDIRANYGFATK
ncbi:SDR family oxidoreductase LALA0_S15e01662g [Lachancea lanzarotensis]|uniref:LALA0S15e01662g1_1 n=1 Tax=Lachancea lanzarotensis TaxID=1245769 RepID=A0A0C7MYB2_9SACH|nr:uncharacterized protein LALA0_S15e01662g [Lachancea lanzarotensis]CEP64978.1 LALA0S15e01662g1_1 [Lachancea lanzarotensis]